MSVPLRRAAVVLTALTLVGWGLLVFVAVPWLIHVAHANPDLPLLGGILAGRDTLAVEFYLDVWQGRHRPYTVLVSVAGASVLLVALLQSLRFPWDERGSAPPLGSCMSPLRRWVVLGTVGTIVGMTVLHVLADRETWPFSQYPMYSGVAGPEGTVYRAVGLVEGGTVPFRDAGYTALRLQYSEHIAPFDPIRLGVVLRNLDRRGAGEEAFEEALTFLLHRYEELREAGRHDDPHLMGVALYQRWWDRDPRLDHPYPPQRGRLVHVVYREER